MDLQPPKEKIHFITGKLAESAVRKTVARLAEELGFEYSIEVLPITVAALMTTAWVLRHVHVPPGTTRLVVPGYLADGVEQLQATLACRVESGPKDIRDLPSHFGKAVEVAADYGEYSIEILAEINFAPRLSRSELLGEAQRLIADGADFIDLGCEPGQRWLTIGDAVAQLKDAGIRCSVDSFDPWEVTQATNRGAELVLSVNHNNREAAVDWGVPVVVVPDSTESERYLASLEETMSWLQARGVGCWLDPILEPIGCGFASSLERYAAVRKNFPESEIMMGIGNLTELTDCDSAGINLSLLALCEEWRIRRVLTTQVITWAQTAVRECDVARRLVAHAHRHRIPPKRLDPRLVMLRDPRVHRSEPSLINDLASKLKDNNYRIFVDDQQLHLLAANVHLVGTDPFEMMSELLAKPEAKNIDAGHAFYLGFELAKALTALTLGKHYEQDIALQWGMLTRSEPHHRVRKRRPKA
jgi:dihydropteroate synthase-like protein